MSVFEFDTRDGARFRFGRSGANAYVEDDTGQRYVFVRDQEADLADFFAERTTPSVSTMQKDLRAILDALGLSTASRPHSPHEVVRREVLPAIQRLWDNAAPQPDRPEPVDPASVRVGDVVEVEAGDGSWMVRGEVNGTDTGQLRLDIGNTRTVWVHVAGVNVHVTVHVLQPAHPEPDPAAVEVLRRVISDVSSTFDGSPLTETAMDRFIRGLIRRGVTVPEVDSD